MSRRSRWLAGAVAVGLGGFALRRITGARVDDVPLARVRARGPIGVDFPDRSGLAGERLVGEMDDLDAFAREEFDTTRVAPAVRRFYERTSEYRMSVTADWHRPFRTGGALAAPLTSALEQLNLPSPRTPERVRVVENDLYAVDPDAAAVSTGELGADARFWVRTDVDTDEAVFVAVYSSHVHDDTRYVNIGVVLPGATLSTVLEPRELPLAARDDVEDGARSDVDAAGTDDVGVELATRARGHPGLFYSLPGGDFRLPMHQTFRVWPADATPAPSRRESTRAGATTGRSIDRVLRALPEDASRSDSIVATQDMWVYGRRFLTVTYAAASRR